MSDLKECLRKLYIHLNQEKVIEIDGNIFEHKTIYEAVAFLRETFKNTYPKTKLKPMMKSIHYANGFQDKELKESAYLLDEIQQYLTINKFLKHDDCVEFFNNKITDRGFVITPESLFKTHLESLMLSVNDN